MCWSISLLSQTETKPAISLDIPNVTRERQAGDIESGIVTKELQENVGSGFFWSCDMNDGCSKNEIKR